MNSPVRSCTPRFVDLGSVYHPYIQPLRIHILRSLVNPFIHHSHFWLTGIFTPEFELGLHHSGEHILFDRKADPDQTRNLINDPAYADIVKELRDRTVAHNREIASPAMEWLE